MDPIVCHKVQGVEKLINTQNMLKFCNVEHYRHFIYSAVDHIYT
jgi:hypothetical protein